MPLRMTGVSLDVTARKRAEERQKLLLDELNHRAKNTLATVQSIVMQTQRSAQTPAAFGEDLAARVAALARAHDLLTQAPWDGASLAEVIGQTLQIYATDADGKPRLKAEGPVVRLGPNAAVTLNMAFHELATNAVKYGALSVQAGRVRVTWQVDHTSEPAIIEIVWCETNGPKVMPPSRRGFGSRLIERGLASELDGEVRLDFAPGGVCCHMRLPVSAKIALAA
jgi:two-component sensor histidine kinase